MEEGKGVKGGKELGLGKGAEEGKGVEVGKGVCWDLGCSSVSCSTEKVILLGEGEFNRSGVSGE